MYICITYYGVYQKDHEKRTVIEKLFKKVKLHSNTVSSFWLCPLWLLRLGFAHISVHFACSYAGPTATACCRICGGNSFSVVTIPLLFTVQPPSLFMWWRKYCAIRFLLAVFHSLVELLLVATLHPHLVPSFAQSKTLWNLFV